EVLVTVPSMLGTVRSSSRPGRGAKGGRRFDLVAAAGLKRRRGERIMVASVKERKQYPRRRRGEMPVPASLRAQRKHVTCPQPRAGRTNTYPMPEVVNPNCVAATMELRDERPDAPCKGTGLGRTRRRGASPPYIGRAGEAAHSATPPVTGGPARRPVPLKGNRREDRHRPLAARGSCGDEGRGRVACPRGPGTPGQGVEHASALLPVASHPAAGGMAVRPLAALSCGSTPSRGWN